MINRDQISNLRKLFIENYQSDLAAKNPEGKIKELNENVPGQVRGLREKIHAVKNTSEKPSSIPLRQARSIAVTSGKGGAGKTNFVANLAVAFSKLGKKVLVLDADLGLANIDVIYGIRPKYNLFHVITGQRHIADIIVEGPAGVFLVPGGSGIVELANLNEGERKHFLSEMSELEKKVDIILVDTSAGINKNVLCFLRACSEIIFITLPEPTAIADAYGIIKAVATGGELSQKLSLVINRVSSSDEARDVYERLALVSKRFLNIIIEDMGYIVEDRAVPTAVRAQSPFIIHSPHCEATRCIEGIAHKLLNIKKDAAGSEASALNKIKEGFNSFFYRVSELFN